MKKLFLIVMMISCVKLHAQSLKKNQAYLIPQIGLLSGDHSNSFQFQLAGGFTAKNWRIGMGTGLDYYKVRSVPIYADVRRYFGYEKSAFAFVNLGFNVPWPLEDQYKIALVPGGNIKNTFEMGWYSDAGLGYDIELGKQKSLSISLGYSIKNFTEKFDDRYDFILQLPFIQPGVTPTERKFEYTFRRLSVKAGFRLW